MRQSLENQTWVTTLDGVHEVADIPKLRSSVESNNDQMRRYLSGSLVTVDRGSLSSALDALRNGYAVGADRIAKFAQDFRSELPTPKSYRRRQRWSDDGDEPSWEREQAGQEEIWRTSRREQQRGPAVIELAAPWGGNGMPDFTWDGVVLVTLCDLLEYAGYRVGASMNKCNKANAPYSFMTRVEIKQPENPLNIDSLAALASHPGVYAWLGRPSIQLQPYNMRGTFGYNVEVTDIDETSRNLIFRPGTVYLKHSYSRTEAVQEIQRVLQLFT